MRTKQVMVKSTKKAIHENDGFYFHHKLFPKDTSLGDLQDKKDYRIKRMLYSDIAEKYGLDGIKIGHYLQHYSIDILRELLIFGKHKYIIDEINIKTTGSF